MRENGVAAGVLVALLLLCVTAMGGVVADTHGGDEVETNESFGEEVSSFMQASVADTETEVDEGMFQASMRRAETVEERRQLVEERQERLAERQAVLQERREEISPDEPDAKNRAVATRVQVGAEGIERSVETTREHAVRAGVGTDQLEQLRERAGELRGQEVAEWARNMTGDRSAGNDRGSNDDRSADDDRSGNWGNSPDSERRGNGTDNGTDGTAGISDGFGN